MTDFTRRQLGRRLKTLRGRQSLRDVTASGIVGSTATLLRLERGESVRLTHPVIRSLAEHYGAPPGLAEELQEMYKSASRDKPWADDFTKSAVRGFSLYLDLEPRANRLRVYEPSLVLGLLQTPEYARELHRRYGRDEGTIVDLLATMDKRHSMFWDRTPLPQLQVLMGEWAVPEGGQLETLLNSMADVRIMKISGVPYPHLREPFTVMSFPERLAEPDCLYVEGLEASRYVEDPEVVSIYLDTFEMLFSEALPIKEL